MRLDWIDRYKGLLIILVVMGHVLGGAVRLTHGLSQLTLDKLYLVIYAFHMPAFFYIAGVTWRNREGEGFGRFVIRKSRRLLVPYVVFGVLSTILYCLFVGGVRETLQNVATTNYYQGKLVGGWWQCILGLLHAGGYPNGEGFRMNSVLWFLPCLFSTEMAYWWIKRIIIRSEVRVLVIVTACVIWGVWGMSGLPWGVSKVPYYLLFVMVGDLCGGWTLPVKCVGPRFAIVMAGTIGYLATVWVLPHPDDMHEWYWRYVDVVLAVIGCGVFAEVAKVCTKKWLAACGIASMGIMLMHKFLVVALEAKIEVVRTFLGGGLLAALIGCATLTAIITAISYGVSRFMQGKAAWALGESC